jgi:hypothetical protein
MARHGPQEPADRANGIDLASETFGDPNEPPIVLIMGLAMRLIALPTSCAKPSPSGGIIITVIVLVVR